MTTTKAILLHDVLTDEEVAAIEAAVPRIPGFANATGSFSARRKVNSDWAGPLIDAIRQRYRTLAEPFTREGGFRFWGGNARWFGDGDRNPMTGWHRDPEPDSTTEWRRDPEPGPRMKWPRDPEPDPARTFLVTWYGGHFSGGGDLEIEGGVYETRRNSLLAYRPWVDRHRVSPFTGHRLLVPVLVGD